MEFRNSIKTLNYVRKMLSSDTEHLLPFPIKPQKPAFGHHSPTPLPRCSPQDAGVSCQALNELLHALSSVPNGYPHTCLVARHGQIVCEAAWAPYSTKIWHVTHSLCKSFTGTAIGMLWDEGKLDLDEKVCSIFPDKCSLMTSRRARNLTVRHLLTMSSGSAFRETGAVVESDWVRGFLESEFEFDPGTQMDYNSMNTYLLSAILKRKVGCGMMDYLRPRLFEPLGFGDVAWEKCPDGIEKGGWGMYVYLEDALKLGQLYLNKGIWNGQRLLSEEWVNAATSTSTQREGGEEYGYQIWTDSEKRFFMFNGMFGQYVLVCPSLDLVVAINAGAGNLFTRSATLQAILQFLKRVQTAVPDSPKAAQDMAFTLSHLTYGRPVPTAPPFSLRGLLSSLFDRSPAPIERSETPIQLLPDSIFAFPQNRASLLPLIPSCMNDWYSTGVEKCQFEKRESALSLLWWEAGKKYTLPIDFSQTHQVPLDFGGNIFLAAVSAKAVLNEDDELVLKLTVHYLELSSVRILKFFFHHDHSLEVQFTETPGIRLVFQMLEQSVPASVKSKMDLFRDMDYLWYRLGKLCTPSLTCNPPATSISEKESETT